MALADNIENAAENPDSNPEIPEVQFDIEIQSIVAKPRKLKSVWSIGARKDFRREFGLKAENQFPPNVFVCREDDIRVYGEIQKVDEADMVTFRTPATGAIHTVWADDLRRMNLLEVLAIEAG